MHCPIKGITTIKGKTYSNFEGDFKEVEPLIKSYLQTLGDSLPDEEDMTWGLPDEDSIVTNDTGVVGILSSGEFFTIKGAQVLTTHIVFNEDSGHILGGYVATDKNDAIIQAFLDGDFLNVEGLDTTDLEKNVGPLSMDEANELSNTL